MSGALRLLVMADHLLDHKPQELFRKFRVQPCVFGQFAQARDLALDEDLGAALYDPQVHYDRTERDTNDWHRDPVPERQSTLTSGIPAQDAKVAPQPLP